jgi:hypothetical protein
VSRFQPQTGSPEEWDAAYYRLEDYLRAHSVFNRIHQSQIILRILERAAVRHAQDTAQDPTRLALEEVYSEIEAWFRCLLPDEGISPERLAIMGRVSLHITDATERWPHAFLAEGKLAPDFVQALRATSLKSGPDLNISSMVPRPLDIPPVTELLEETWQRLGRVSFAILIGMGALFLGGIFFYLHSS